jgi:23S rRNA U2552 (ribose-2'-O)-methylase RlmE/FtsJ
MLPHAVEYPLVRASVREGGVEDDARPAPSAAFVALAEAKEGVPSARVACGKARWRFETDVSAPTPMAPVGVRMASRAYLKMAEIATTCALRPPCASAHLCEAPGGFVQATAAFAGPQWTWVGLSQRGPPFPAKGLPTARGRFVEGDAFDFEACLRALAPFLPSGREGVCLVTADGADAMDHAGLEGEHRPLLLAQTRLALSLLRTDGDFVVKFFEGGEAETERWVALLTTLFASVSVIKPTASRPTNSERYLVCRSLGEERGEAAWARFGRPCATSSAWRSECAAVMDALARGQTTALRSLLQKVSGGGAGGTAKGHPPPPGARPMGRRPAN